jgi:Cdc6-like AAA superfamily ATPase
MAPENRINGRLLAHPFLSQLKSIDRTRKDDPTRLIQWVRYLEQHLPYLETEYNNLDPEGKGLFRQMQIIFETVTGDQFRGRQITAVGTRQSNVDPFQIMAELVKVVAAGHTHGLLLVGPGGLGKTWTTRETLKDLGKQEGKDYYRIPGYSTPLGLYQTLQEHPTDLFVFDDCDSIFKDEVGLNILKSALDTHPDRHISWRSNTRFIDTKDFVFTGRVIFISNLDPTTNADRNFQALLTRVMTFIIGTTQTEVLNRMIRLLPVMAPDLSTESRSEIREFLEQNYTRVPNLSVRYLKHLLGLYSYSRESWQTLAISLS